MLCVGKNTLKCNVKQRFNQNLEVLQFFGISCIFKVSKNCLIVDKRFLAETTFCAQGTFFPCFAFHSYFVSFSAEEDEDKKLLSEVVAKDLDWHLFNITAAEYCGHSLQVETEKLGYFVPSRIPPSFTNKIENTAPRFLKFQLFLFL